MLLPMRAQRYWPLFYKSGTRHSIEPLLLAAICDAESECGESKRLDKKGPAGRADGGHGHGLMQIDDRSHKAFIQEVTPDGIPLWALPEENIDYAAGKVLSPALGAFSNDWPAAIGAYNAGVWAVHKALLQIRGPTFPTARLVAINAVTANGNYVTRVLVRYRSYGGELPQWMGGALGPKAR